LPWLGVLLREDGASELERRVRSGKAAIDGGLEQHLFDFVTRHAAIARGAEVQRELFAAVERHEHREAKEAARAPVEARAAPDLAPGVAREQVEELAVEFGAIRGAAVDVRRSEHRAPHVHP